MEDGRSSGGQLSVRLLVVALAMIPVAAGGRGGDFIQRAWSRVPRIVGDGALVGVDLGPRLRVLSMRGGGEEDESTGDPEDYGAEVQEALRGWTVEEEEEVQRMLKLRDARPPRPKTPTKDAGSLGTQTPTPPLPPAATFTSAGAGGDGGVQFNDDVRAAVEEARARGACLLVWMPGEDETTRRMAMEVWKDGGVAIAATLECVPTRVLPDTAESAWLEEAHGLPKDLPAILIIGPTGKLAGRRSGGSTAIQILRTIDMALATVGLGGTTAAALRERQKAIGKEVMSGGGAGGVLEDARRALRKGGAGAAAGKVPGKAPRDGAVDDRGRGGFGEQGEAATDMFDRLYRSEIARRKAERMADAGSSAPVRRFGPGTVPGGSITSIPPGLGLDEIQALVCSAGEGGDVVFRGGGNHSWRWDLEVCEEGLVGWQYDDLCERYMDEGQAWEWARQEERAPIVPMRMREEMTMKNAAGGGDHKGFDPYNVTRNLHFRCELGVHTLGRWWLKLDSRGSFTDMLCSHMSNAMEPCPHTPPMSLRVPPEAYKPWSAGDKGVALAGIFEMPDKLVPEYSHVHTVVSFNTSLMTNEEGMELVNGRWEGEHGGGTWEGNLFSYKGNRRMVFLDHDEDDLYRDDLGGGGEEEEEEMPRVWTEPSSGEKVVGVRNPHVYRHCQFCLPRVRNLFNVMGGPWNVSSCELRGGRVVCLRASHRKSDVSLRQCFVGGMSSFIAQEVAGGVDLTAGIYTRGATEDGTPTLAIWDGFESDLRAHYGLSGMETGASICATECTIRDCGYAEGGGGQFVRGARGVFEGCNVERCYRGIGVDDTASVTVRGTRLTDNRRGCFFAMASSSGASLTLENNVVEGRMWEALNRPGTLSQTGNKIVVPAGEYVREGQAEDSDC